MQDLVKRTAEKTIDYVVPVACAAAMLWFGKLPEDFKTAMPYIVAVILSLCSVIQSGSTRRQVGKLRKIHEEAGRSNDLMVEAMRAQLDDAMGKLYAGCVSKGFTTEDERRCYDRMEKAYEGIGGNGEAKRRASRFFALKPEEEWRMNY